jgi:hypothetical protein
MLDRPALSAESAHCVMNSFHWALVQRLKGPFLAHVADVKLRHLLVALGPQDWL